MSRHPTIMTAIITTVTHIKTLRERELISIFSLQFLQKQDLIRVLNDRR